MESFQEWENKGRSWFTEFLKQYGVTDIILTEDPFDPVDLYFTHKGKKVVVEIKCRDLKYLDYDEHIIEEKKLLALQEAKERENCYTAYYVNFFGENTMIIHTLANINTTGIEYLYCNNSTAEFSYKREKRIIYIPKCLGWIYLKRPSNTQINIWKLTNQKI